MTNDIYIVTLRLDQPSQDYFNALRRAHFPAALNYLDAHLTLFHQMPAAEPGVMHALKQAARIEPFPLQVTKVYHTGFGVAFGIESKQLSHMHLQLQQAFNSWLSPQDKQPFRPHVTIQNKVSPEASKLLAAELQQSFEPFVIIAIGIEVWVYRNGPWEHHSVLKFHK